jgi:septum formation protein
MTTPLLLASASPRRRDMLASVQIPFAVEVPSVDESPLPGEAAAALTLRLAEVKARAVHRRRPRAEGLVLAADTAVVIDGDALGKPRDRDHAVAMLRRLGGRDHVGMTGFGLLDQASGAFHGAVAETRVWFRDLEDEEIQGYVDTGEPMDKAGAYACQGIGAFLIARVEGSYTNVVGLPLGQVLGALRRLGGPTAFGTGRRA